MENKSSIKVNVFKAELALRGIPHYQLASSLGLSPTTMSNFLHGRMRTEETNALRERIEIHLGLEPGTLLNGEK